MVVADPPVPARTFEGRRAVWKVVPTLPSEWPRPEGVSRMVAHLLYQRGIDTPDNMSGFLGGLPAEHNPSLMPDLDEAVDRIGRAVRAGERVTIWGDFDADGLTAAAVMKEALEFVGLEPQVIIPTREQNHGLRTEVIAELAASGTSLLITVDCGITDFAPVAAARAAGIDVIITDHHTPDASGKLPEALVMAPSRLDSRYPFARLAGSGVAYKLAQALMGDSARYEQLLDLVVLGTVCDVVPLVDENRTLVARGITYLERSPRPGLRALLQAAGVSRDRIDGSTIGFYLGPRINAANRMANPNIAFQLITASNSDAATHLAEQLDTFNSKRQDHVRDGIHTVIEQIGPPLAVKEAIRDGSRPPIITIVGDWPPGISGLLASELSERYCVPAMVGSLKDDGTVAVSGRSVRDVSILEIQERARAKLADAFLGGGGHAMACGFTANQEQIETVFLELGEAARGHVPIEDLVPSLTIDAQVHIRSMNADAVASVERLEPYGHAFEAPLFMAQRVTLGSREPFGDGGRHVRLKARSSDGRISAIIFNCDPELADVPEEQPVDIVFNLRRNEYRGTWIPEIVIRDWRISD